MNLIDQAFGIHSQALELRSKRVEVISRNIANADTPNYKAQDIDFKSVLQKTLMQKESGMTAGQVSPGDGLKYRIPFNVAFDGNTVELNIEQAQFGKSAADYQATLNILENRISGIRRALRGD